MNLSFTTRGAVILFVAAVAVSGSAQETISAQKTASAQEKPAVDKGKTLTPEAALN